MNLFQFSGSVGARVLKIMSDRNKEVLRAEAVMQRLEAQFGERMPEEARRKVITSYSIYQPMIVDAFIALRGREATTEEKERLVLYFICSGAFDDFVDRNELSSEDLHTISFHPENFQPHRIEEKMFLHCHLTLRNFVHDRASYDETSRGLFRAQLDSVRQTSPEPMQEEELLRITLEKGGYAVHLCHFYLDHDAFETERSCWYRIGGIIQLTNDLFDIWRDGQAGIQTLANKMTNAHVFHDFLSALVQEMMQIIGELPVTNARKHAFLLNMMAVCSFSDMAVNRLRRIQGNEPQLPDIKNLPRKALIMDMEKPANIWHCMRFTWQRCKEGRRMFLSDNLSPA